MTAVLKTYVVTFNCGREPLITPKFAAHLFDNLPKPHVAPDILIFALQEVAPIAYAFLGGTYLSSYLLPFRHAVELAASPLDANYVHIITRNVGLTAIMVFVLRDKAAQVQSIETAGVGVGLHEMGNKGAVAVRLGYSIGDSTLEIAAIAAHLAPMEDALERRNEDWKNICRGLVFTPLAPTTGNKKGVRVRAEETTADPETEPLLSSSTSTVNAHSSMTGIYTPTSHLILAGDLNYRTSLASPIAEEFRSFPQPCSDDSYPQHYEHLLHADQLTTELRANRTCQGLVEAPVDFPPTYKYSDRARRDAHVDRGNMDDDGKYWDWAKHRWPSWCDRVLYLPSPLWMMPAADTTDMTVKVQRYQALPLMPSSDHRPVACFLEIPAVAIPPAPTEDGNHEHEHDSEGEGGGVATGQRQRQRRQGTADQARRQPPFPLNPAWKSQRTWARRREVIVGLGAYLALTWEGRGILLALVCGALGGWAIIGSQV